MRQPNGIIGGLRPLEVSLTAEGNVEGRFEISKEILTGEKENKKEITRTDLMDLEE